MESECKVPVFSSTLPAGGDEQLPLKRLADKVYANTKRKSANELLPIPKGWTVWANYLKK